MRKLYLLKYGATLCMLLVSLITFAQTGTLTGRVFDDTNLPMPFAGVTIKGTKLSTGTNVDGIFKFTGLPLGQHTVVVNSMGFEVLEKTINVTANTNITLYLKASATSLNEVVVIGYGTKKKDDLTGAVGTLSNKEFNAGAVNSVQEAISGRIAGVTVTSISGAPGNTSTIRIRGGASLNASNDPLIIIDNVPVDNTPIGGSPNILSSINPNDVENVTVLKDASATAIYGSRASNGVILITTKKGGEKFKVTYGLTTSLATVPNKVAVYTGDEFRALVNKIYAGQQPVLSLLGTANTDWQDAIYQNAFGQDHNVGVSGTWKKMPYRVSLGYNNTDGTLKTYNFERTTLAINANPTFLKNSLKLNFNVKGMYNNNNFADQGAIGNAVYYDPTKPVYNGNERWRGFTTWTQDNTLNGNPVPLATPNPVAQLELTDNTSTVKRSIGNAQADYQFPFLKELRANLNLGYDYTISQGHNNVKDSTQWVNSPAVSGGRINPYEERRRNQLLDFYLNYSKEVKSIQSKIDVMGGYSWSHFYREGADSSMNVTKTAKGEPNIYSSEYYLVSFFGRLNYTFKDKYLVTFTLRDDATSRFDADNRWGLFPSVAVAWKINDDFFKNNKTISDLKLRVGYGTTGQQDLNNGNNYPYLAKYTISDNTSRYQFGNSFYNTLRPDGYDANIKWESTNTANIGLDYGFLDNRITGTLDFYQKKTNDLLSIVDVPAGTNFSARVLTNVGDMENKGVEFTLNAKILTKSALKWNVNYNISYNKNEITNLSLTGDPNYQVLVGGIAGTTSGTIQVQKVGYPVNSYFVYEQVYDRDGKPMEDVYVDRNNDGIINSSDLYVFKKPDATVLMGIGTNLSYKRWDFSAFGRLSLGNYNYNNVAANSTYRGFYSTLGYLSNQTMSASDTRFMTALKTNTSDYYIQDASYFRLDNISLGYRLPALWNNKVNLRINANVQNVFVITNYDGLDPEISGGLDNNFYPRSRTFQLGVNCDF
ncbi:SusC/RagA family TonB-linked outer membrane protein [Solitalea canadensis]|uniref:TonB-linked outer membrane protein, SusC/RagA family n=1 Tax=Solitalea canadensis (strain ATCC 29591 / DSM 3403 / JCM 21819 / LMG 8368 / NBRC 15130 / NCIMB 12057 / USAM 9D) TaxID=929556 RepID=H8KR82_SOLCM|nr:SusC/RagA family TonB-linked outer membrane protein [Solitalea canadensis]AFD07349.1 TonB-linked outer membrane protein, SusC/RagA family [Solitalea canadensis DSM 3403]